MEKKEKETLEILKGNLIDSKIYKNEEFEENKEIQEYLKIIANSILEGNEVKEIENIRKINNSDKFEATVKLNDKKYKIVYSKDNKTDCEIIIYDKNNIEFKYEFVNFEFENGENRSFLYDSNNNIEYTIKSQTNDNYHLIFTNDKIIIQDDNSKERNIIGELNYSNIAEFIVDDILTNKNSIFIKMDGNIPDMASIVFRYIQDIEKKEEKDIFNEKVQNIINTKLKNIEKIDINLKKNLINAICRGGNINTFKYLILNNFNQNKEELFINSVHSKKNYEIFHILEEDFEDLSKEIFFNVLKECCKSKNLDLVNYFLNKYSENIDFEDESDKEKIYEIFINTDDLKLNKLFLENFKDFGFDLIKYINENKKFFEIIDSKDNNFINLLLSFQDLDVNVTNDEEDKTPIYIAVESGKVEIVKALLSRKDLNVNLGKDIVEYHKGDIHNRLDENYYADNDDMDEYSDSDYDNDVDDDMDYDKYRNAYEDLDGKINNKNIVVDSPLHLAIEKYNDEIINLLVSCPNLDINTIHIGEDSEKKNSILWSAIELMGQYGTYYININGKDYDLIKDILIPRDDININERRVDDGETLLNFFIKNNDDYVDNLLSKEDIDINKTGNDGKTALICAIEIGNSDLIDKLLAREDIKINKVDNLGKTALCYAIESGKNDIIDKLLAREDIKINKGISLICAIKSENNDLIDKLLTMEEDININAIDNSKKTALFYAIEKDNYNLIDKLLSRKDIDINIKSKKFDTLLHYAIENNKNEIAETLLSRNDLNPNTGDFREKTPLILAIIRKNYEIAKKLISRPDINLNMQAENGMTALHTAIEDGNNEIIKTLLSKENINVNLKTKHGQKTPLTFAIEKNNIEIIKLLLINKELEIEESDKKKLDEMAEKNEELKAAIGQYKKEKLYNGLGGVNNEIDNINKNQTLEKGSLPS